MQFVYLGSRFTLHASSPRSVTLTQLRFNCLAVVSSAGDLHPEDRAHAGRTSRSAVGPRPDTSPQLQLQNQAQALGRLSYCRSGLRQNARLLRATCGLFGLRL